MQEMKYILDPLNVIISNECALIKYQERVNGPMGVGGHKTNVLL